MRTWGTKVKGEWVTRGQGVGVAGTTEDRRTGMLISYGYGGGFQVLNAWMLSIATSVGKVSSSAHQDHRGKESYFSHTHTHTPKIIFVAITLIFQQGKTCSRLLHGWARPDEFFKALVQLSFQAALAQHQQYHSMPGTANQSFLFHSSARAEWSGYLVKHPSGDSKVVKADQQNPRRLMQTRFRPCTYHGRPAYR